LSKHEADNGYSQHSFFLRRDSDTDSWKIKGKSNETVEKKENCGNEAQRRQGIHGDRRREITVCKMHHGPHGAAGRTGNAEKPLERTGGEKRKNREQSCRAQRKQRYPAIDEAEFNLARVPLPEDDAHGDAALPVQVHHAVEGSCNSAHKQRNRKEEKSATEKERKQNGKGRFPCRFMPLEADNGDRRDTAP
jgi:hypothetical protein